MEKTNEELQKQILVCRNILHKGYTNIKNTRLPWLNTFCLEFFKFSQNLHIFLSLLNEKVRQEKGDHIEIIFLCLTQIVTCIKHMENTIKAEEREGAALSASRQHFLDRIHWCLSRLRTCLNSVVTENSKKAKLPEEKSFIELVDKALDLLAPYSSYREASNTEKFVNIAENHAEALFDSQEIRSIVDLVLGHTLAFANVALQQDKKALSALCQKVLRECMAFQEECKNSMFPGAPDNESIRKIKATSLENSLYKLEDYLNEALLRLLFTSFLDLNKFSIHKLRKVIKEKDADDPELDELIADFDVNVDRITQIGLFAIAFSSHVKMKTRVRSCLASLESLDSCIIPSLQTKGSAEIFSKILEQHFNEEVSIFKNCMQELVDSHAFASCFYELLTQTIKDNDKEYNKQSLEEIIGMAGFLYEHFQLPFNYIQLQKEEKRLDLFNKFHLMIQECQAVLNCQNLQLEPKRVLKRFKVLRSILRKFNDEMKDKADNGIENKSQIFLMPEETMDESLQIFSSLNITPSTSSILYDNQQKQRHRQQQLLNDSVKANTSKVPLTSPPVPASIISKGQMIKIKQCAEQQQLNKAKSIQHQRSSLRRKESLRTSLFKRQKLCETQQIYNVYKNNTDSLQISEILDQLTGLSSNLSQDMLNKSFIG